MCLTGNKSVTHLLKQTHTHTHILRVLYIGKFHPLGELGIISQVLTDILNIRVNRPTKFLDFITVKVYLEVSWHIKLCPLVGEYIPKQWPKEVDTVL
jgi:hypothetical protein